VINDLLLFLALFSSAPRDLQPAFPTFFQPHGAITAFEFSNLSRYDTSDYQWTWRWHDREYQGFDLPLNELLPMFCEGAFPLTLVAVDVNTGASFERSECVWVTWTYYEFAECDMGCSIIDAGAVVIWENWEQYQYRNLCGLDKDCDGLHDVDDLLDLLSQ